MRRGINLSKQPLPRVEFTVWGLPVRCPYCLGVAHYAESRGACLLHNYCPLCGWDFHGRPCWNYSVWVSTFRA